MLPDLTTERLHLKSRTVADLDFIAALNAVVKAKPSGAKGKYVQTITVSATMGPGVPVETAAAVKAAS